mgnify:FL=1
MALTDEERNEILSIIKSVLEKFSPPMVITKNGEKGIELIGNKAVPYGSKKIIVPGMYFCSAVARKNMVSFYFFPIYMANKEFIDLIPTMKKTLKGKTCFNIKKIEQIDKKELFALVKKGVSVWKKLGYMK